MLGGGGWVKATNITHFIKVKYLVCQRVIDYGEKSSRAGRWRVYGGRVWVRENIK